MTASKDPSSSPLDRLFQGWLALLGAEPAADAEAWLATQPEEHRAHLRRLIEEHRPREDAAAEDAPSFEEGRELGDFRLVQELGRGGMGSVWEAEQISLKRRVALKLLKPQFSFSPRLLHRFQREAEAGGRLQHAGIVQTYGVGEAEGIHWIAQELVPGGFTLADSLAELRQQPVLPEGYYRGVGEFFAMVADALEHAHQAGVIHRDIKPQNLLITEGDDPKVADFGLAQVQDDLGLSRSGDFLGTPFYMSPEQALSKRMGLDHRTDVFSLGVTLYEALTLVRAFGGDTSQQVFQKIVTEEPADPRRIRSRVPRDLVVICQKCLEKNPDRRYPSMAELAADLRRHLHDEPIVAKLPGAATRAVKWCRRHRVVAASGAVALVALTVISGLALRIAREQSRTETALVKTQAAEKQASTDRAAAEERARQLQEVTDYQSGQLEKLDAEELGWGARTALFDLLEEAGERSKWTAEKKGEHRSALEKGAQGLDWTGLGLRLLEKHFFQGALETLEDFEDQPRVQAQLLQTMASVLREAGLLEQAEAPQRQALEIRQRELGEDHPNTLNSVSHLASLLHDQGNYEEEEPLLWASLDGFRRVLGADHPSTLTLVNNLALLLQDQGKYEEAEPRYRECLKTRRRVLGADHPDTLIAVNNLAVLLKDQGKYEEAEPLLRECLESSRRVLGADHPDTLISVNNLATLLLGQGKYAEADPLIRESLEGFRRELGADHPDTLTAVNNLAMILQDQGKNEEAEPLFRECLESSRRVLGADHPETLIAVNNLAVLLKNQGNFEEAEPLYRECLESRRRVSGADHPNTLIAVNNLAILLEDQGMYAEAELLYRECMESSRRVLGADHPDTLDSVGNLVTCLHAEGKDVEALPLMRDLLARTPKDHPKRAARESLLAKIEAALADDPKEPASGGGGS